MQFFSNARRLARVLKPQPLNSAAHHNSFNNAAAYRHLLYAPKRQPYEKITSNASFSTTTTTTPPPLPQDESSPSGSVKEFYDKIIESVNVKRSMSPNAWLWSLIDNCKNHNDIQLLFHTLHNLRIFRLSNLRIHDNFNCHLCREVTKACARIGAIDFAKKSLSKHNVYGLTPNIGSANHLLSYAKEHNDVDLMVEVIKLLKRNDIQLQPSTADIVFSICYHAGNWKLLSKYSKKFLQAGVKLRRTAFDLWMDFAIKRGDTESLWQIEKLRSESMQKHTLVSGFSCAKGLILEHKLEDAAAVIKVLSETLSDTKKSEIVAELQKLVSEWPSDVIKHQPEENRKALAAALESDIPAMVNGLLNMGLEVDVDLENLSIKEKILV